MFERFLNRFTPDYQATPHFAPALPSLSVFQVEDLLRIFGGLSFERGLYRIGKPTDLDAWRERLSLAFPEFGRRVTCFAFDWLGTVFAVDSNYQVNGQPGVVLFEPGTGKALKVPCNLYSFHDTGLLEFEEAALATNFHRKWLASGGIAPDLAQCVGYRKPLFLGGPDDVANLELIDLDVYWHITGQLVRKIRSRPNLAEQ